MRRRSLLWVTAFAVLSMSCANLAIAHSLPGTVLTLAQEDDGPLLLTVRLPLEDLVLASPDLAVIEDFAIQEELPAEHLTRLEEYFGLHLRLKTAADEIRMTLNRAVRERGEHHDVGTYDILVLHLGGDVDGDVWPLSLTYDAIMHEVRSHRTSVYWRELDGDLTPLANFRYRTTNGKPQPIVLHKP